MGTLFQRVTTDEISLICVLFLFFSLFSSEILNVQRMASPCFPGCIYMKIWAYALPYIIIWIHPFSNFGTWFCWGVPCMFPREPMFAHPGAPAWFNRCPMDLCVGHRAMRIDLRCVSLHCDRLHMRIDVMGSWLVLLLRGAWLGLAGYISELTWNNVLGARPDIGLVLYWLLGRLALNISCLNLHIESEDLWNRRRKWPLLTPETAAFPPVLRQACGIYQLIS